jgi:hypothetical protein
MSRIEGLAHGAAGLAQAAGNSSVDPSSFRTCFAVAASQTLTVRSRLAEATCRPSGSKPPTYLPMPVQSDIPHRTRIPDGYATTCRSQPSAVWVPGKRARSRPRRTRDSFPRPRPDRDRHVPGGRSQLSAVRTPSAGVPCRHRGGNLCSVSASTSLALLSPPTAYNSRPSGLQDCVVNPFKVPIFRPVVASQNIVPS